MKTEDLLKEKGIIMTDFISSSTYDAVVKLVDELRKPAVSGSLPLTDNELWIEANKLYSKKEHSQDGRDLQMKHFTIHRRQ